jgi:glycerol-1-phosphate dehydrogenase [NAD(P)+]
VITDSPRISAALGQATDTEQVVIGEGVLGSAAELFTRVFPDRRAVVVADENTFRVAGEAVQRELQSPGVLMDTFVFPGRPVLHADYQNITTLIEWLGQREAIAVAVGSGTLNDIVKRSSHECDRGYMSVATAASVDGYTAFGASITREGFKQTLECRAPRAVLADLEVLTQAPPRMTSAGYADLLAKITAGADWLLADALDVEPIEPTVWSLVQDPLREATGRPADVRAGDGPAMAGLIEGLIMSGLAMQAAGSSRPASGAEHQFSHLWEMEGLGHEPAGDEPPLSHGFKVGVGTVSIAALYERVLARDLTDLDPDGLARAWPSWTEVESRIRSTFSSDLQDSVVEQSRAKYIDADQLIARLRLLSERWPELRDRLRDQLLPAARLRDLLTEAGCPTRPEQIGLSTSRFAETYRRAQMIRPRYTVLDLLTETDLLDECVAELFAGSGFWGQELAGHG